ncbi:ABC transporter permease [Rhizobium sp. 18055]|uniref:ABC transporter permease n=1 Tax=Rhizobium sp. 18055 TaxID=2681403 RepID=UPI00135907EB|nr:ABC transporter permease [Rhizobium sp. 18055]
MKQILRSLRSPSLLIAVLIIGFTVGAALFANFLAPYSPYFGGDLQTERLLPPSLHFWLGTDDQARDIYSRLLFGTRLTLLITVLSMAISLPLGLAIGVISGYFGGLVDGILMRITDVALGFPKLVFALALAAALGPGVENAIVAIALTNWPPYARLARAEALRLRNSDFVAACRLQGAGPFYIIRHHILPLTLPNVIVRATLDVSSVILTAAALGFLGLGAQAPAAEWGAMIAAGQRYLLDQWWVAAVPGIAICLLSLSFNMLGDVARDNLDPRSGR